MTAPLRIGIISFAHGHAAAYCRRMSAFEDVRMVACWDDNVERGEKMAAEFGMSFSPHVEDVIQHPEVDAVIVTCETDRHPEMVIAAAEAGKAILCQKPMALTLADCDRMSAAVERAGVPFMMAFQMRQDPSNIRIKELVESGAVGKVGLLRRRHAIPLLFNQDFVTGPTRWHFEPKRNIGMFFDDASHAADFIHWVMGRPVSVMAEIGNTLTDVAPDDMGVAIYRFADGSMAELVNSSVMLAGENTSEVYGDAGVIIQNHDDSPSTNGPRVDNAIALKLWRRGEPAWEDQQIAIPANHGERIQGVPRAFVDYVLKGTPPTATAEDGRVAVEMILAAYQSAREGRRIEIGRDDGRRTTDDR
ncbi:gfo/Idh/MocA family oxidoreductase [bacterium]|nr:gfo/Idh/MocA family oxidoreductase [bacterium]